jgi:hypothetical protein
MLKAPGQTVKEEGTSAHRPAHGVAETRPLWSVLRLFVCTVKSTDWRMAKAWLYRELAKETDGPRTLEAR